MFGRTGEMWIWRKSLLPTGIPGPPRLEAPHPDATPAEVRTFLTQYAIRLLGITHHEASTFANRVPIGGLNLYQSEECCLENLHGFLGRMLYYELQHSKYGVYRNIWGYYGPTGFVPSGVIYCILVVVAILTDVWSHWWRTKCQIDEGLPLIMFGGGVIEVPVWLFWLCCGRRAVLRSEYWPEWAKARMGMDPTRLGLFNFYAAVGLFLLAILTVCHLLWLWTLDKM